MTKQKWEQDKYDQSAREAIVAQLKAKGIEAKPQDIQIDPQQSLYPKLKKKTGVARISWSLKTKTGDGSLEGRVEMKGDFGGLGLDKADLQRFDITNVTSPSATAAMQLESDRKTARQAAIEQARTKVKNRVTGDLTLQHLDTTPLKVEALHASTGDDKMDFLFKTKATGADGRYIVKGTGSVKLSWNGAQISGMSADPIQITKNRRTFGSWAKAKFGGGTRKVTVTNEHLVLQMRGR